MCVEGGLVLANLYACNTPPLTRVSEETVATHGIREQFILSNQTFVTFPSLSYLLTLCCFITFCHLVNLSSFYQASVIFSPFVIYAPYKCTCCTPHKHTSLSCLIVRTLSAPIYLSQFNRRLWLACHSDMGGSRHGWGFSLRTK